MPTQVLVRVPKAAVAVAAVVHHQADVQGKGTAKLYEFVSSVYNETSSRPKKRAAEERMLQASSGPPTLTNR